MNLQKPPNAIEWTRIRNTDGTYRRGYTWNPVAGCFHDCVWQMPDGSLAQCYAKTVAEKFVSAYPKGFENHYFHPARLEEPLRVKEPAGIFLDSMSDLMGHWVPEDEIFQVIDVCTRADWHIFQLLTKNAPRLNAKNEDGSIKFKFPKNVWAGVSSPPTFFMGKEMSRQQQGRFVSRTLDVLNETVAGVRWMSIEPLSFDIAEDFSRWQDKNGKPAPIEWAVIGAASNGRTLYQPDIAWVDNILKILDENGTPVFFKGNLDYKPERFFFPHLG